jgi:hypothetical protein
MYLVLQAVKAARLQVPKQAARALATCPMDETLPHAPAGRRHLLAVNLHNSATLIPVFAWQLLQLAAMLPTDALRVSVYDSASTDSSSVLLAQLQVSRHVK